MQFLIPFVLAFSLASASVSLNLLPYAYLSSPIPVYRQYQNTETGEHAFSYAGGPSAKEEIKDADGVLRGSYSYIDANGILQSVFYVADDNGFRVAATNLPSDNNVQLETTQIEPDHVILARSTKAEEASKSRKRRSILATVLEGSGQNEQIVSQSSSQDNVRNNEKHATGKALFQPLLLTNDVPLATSHQSQVQVHRNTRVELTEPIVKTVEPIVPVQTLINAVPILNRAPNYHENRIELHKDLGIEGPNAKDAVKINSEPVTLVESSPIVSTVITRGSSPIVPVITKETVPVVPATSLGTASVTTSISSHEINQIHSPSKRILTTSGVLAKEVPVLTEKKEILPLVPLIKQSSDLSSATVTTSISSHGISQIHGDSKPSLFFRTAPITQLHPIFPIYLH